MSTFHEKPGSPSRSLLFPVVAAPGCARVRRPTMVRPTISILREAQQLKKVSPWGPCAVPWWPWATPWGPWTPAPGVREREIWHGRHLKEGHYEHGRGLGPGSLGSEGGSTHRGMHRVSNYHSLGPGSLGSEGGGCMHWYLMPWPRLRPWESGLRGRKEACTVSWMPWPRLCPWSSCSKGVGMHRQLVAVVVATAPGTWFPGRRSRPRTWELGSGV